LTAEFKPGIRCRKISSTTFDGMERLKFTYRYSSDIEELLNKAMQKRGLKSMNKLIDMLILEALVELPHEIREREKKLDSYSKSLQKTETERDKALSQLYELKSLITQEKNIKKRIENILK
jgi:asparagine synthetase B (glutamine-hydrolysing)